MSMPLMNRINAQLLPAETLILSRKVFFAPPFIMIHSKITMAGDVVPYYTVTALVPLT